MVICYPAEILRRKAMRVEEFGADLEKTVRGMFETMYAANGVGLAAPQAGMSIRVCVMNCGGGPDGELVLVNPEITDEQESVSAEEGCLSFPGIFIDVRRAARVKVRYQDVGGQEGALEAEGLLARAIQHEIDHLNGVLLVDKMSTVQRLANRRALKMLEARHDRGETDASQPRAEARSKDRRSL